MNVLDTIDTTVTVEWGSTRTIGTLVQLGGHTALVTALRAPDEGTPVFFRIEGDAQNDSIAVDGVCVAISDSDWGEQQIDVTIQRVGTTSGATALRDFIERHGLNRGGSVSVGRSRDNPDLRRFVYTMPGVGAAPGAGSASTTGAPSTPPASAEPARARPASAPRVAQRASASQSPKPAAGPASPASQARDAWTEAHADDTPAEPSSVPDWDRDESGAMDSVGFDLDGELPLLAPRLLPPASESTRVPGARAAEPAPVVAPGLAAALEGAPTPTHVARPQFAPAGRTTPVDRARSAQAEPLVDADEADLGGAMADAAAFLAQFELGGTNPVSTAAPAAPAKAVEAPVPAVAPQTVATASRALRVPPSNIAPPASLVRESRAAPVAVPVETRQMKAVTALPPPAAESAESFDTDMSEPILVNTVDMASSIPAPVDTGGADKTESASSLVRRLFSSIKGGEKKAPARPAPIASASTVTGVPAGFDEPAAGAAHSQGLARLDRVIAPHRHSVSSGLMAVQKLFAVDTAIRSELPIQFESGKKKHDGVLQRVAESKLRIRSTHLPQLYERLVVLLPGPLGVKDVLPLRCEVTRVRPAGEGVDSSFDVRTAGGNPPAVMERLRQMIATTDGSDGSTVPG
ncbi:MAG: hypothetical protein EXR79_09335 [Myxococcales bacterium]|nr:hypothetical protein [Myxococcales bacterium]